MSVPPGAASKEERMRGHPRASSAPGSASPRQRARRPLHSRFFAHQIRDDRVLEAGADATHWAISARAPTPTLPGGLPLESPALARRLHMATQFRSWTAIFSVNPQIKDLFRSCFSRPRVTLLWLSSLPHKASVRLSLRRLYILTQLPAAGY